MNKLILLSAAASVALASHTASAANATVQAQITTFSPDIVFVDPGDTLSFRHMPTHQVQSVQTMSPPGAAPLESRMGVDYDYKIDKQGIYVYRCTIHWPARMGGVVVAGKPANAKAVIEQYRKTATGYDAPAKALLDKLEAELPKHGL